MSGNKILVVEDEWLVARGITENLKDLGYEVVGMASSGEEAMRLAAENQPDLVVMDILLQGDMDGIEAAEYLRNALNIPVVFLTAYADSQTLERAKVTEPYGYILKPFELRELQSAIEIGLYKNRAEKRLQHLTEVLRAIRNVNQIIVQEKDRNLLIEKACQLLTERQGYFTAWIVLVDKARQVVGFAVAGEKGDTHRLQQMLEKGEMPLCGQRALNKKDMIVMEDLSPQSGCLLWENYQDRGVLVTPLVHQNYSYGLLGVLLPRVLSIDEEEISLFQELADDLSLALYKLDLEEREQQSQELLKASEEKFRLFFEKAPVGYQSLNDQGVILEVNPTWLETLGYVREEVVGRSFGEFLTPEYRELFTERFECVKRSGEVNEVVFDMMKKDGSFITVSFMGRIAFDSAGNFKQTHCVFSDITDRQLAEKALQESEERYRTVADFTYDMEYWLGPDQRLLYMSPSCERLTGYTRKEFFQDQNLTEKIVHPEDQGIFAAHHEEARDCLDSLGLDFRLLHRDGREIWVSHICQPVSGLDGRYLGRRVSNSDITERKLAEQGLQKNEERFRLLFNNVSDAVFVHEVSPDTFLPGRFIEVNDIACQYLGYTRKELLQMSVPQIDAPEVLENVPIIIRKLFAEGRAMWEGIHLSKEGCRIPVEISNQLFEFNGKPMILSTVRNISERKRAEEALRESEERLRFLVENAPDAIFIQTEESFAYLNKEALRLFGASTVDQLLGQPVMDRFHPDFHKKVKERIRLLNMERKAVPQLEQQYLKMDGTPFDVEVSAVPFRYKERNGALVFARDITDRKEAERTQKILEAQLLQAQKMEALGTLAGGIAHDFNNILGAMTGFAELAALELSESQEERYYLDNLLKAGDRARHLVKQILSFSRREKVDRRPIALSPIIKEINKFLRASLPTTIEIRLHLKAKRDIIVADPTQIHQVLLNLATNAAQAMEEKGGVMEISLKFRQLSSEEINPYEEIAAGPYLELWVSDTGHGMEQYVLERIFEPFFTTKDAGRGTGMGLAVVYGIVKDHGGVIRVNSTPGMGTTFQVLLPTLEAVFAEEEVRVLEPLSKGSERILFVDDDEDFFQVGQEMLAELGYKVAAYNSSLKALEEFEARPLEFDVIICDQTMPGMTGLEFAAACSRLRPDIPIILCTGFSAKVTPESVRAAGIMEVANKPFNLRKIGKIIKKVLKKVQPEPE